jgi:hypothetical protein
MFEFGGFPSYLRGPFSGYVAHVQNVKECIQPSVYVVACCSEPDAGSGRVLRGH